MRKHTNKNATFHRVEWRGGNRHGEPFRFQQYRSNFLDTDTKTPPPHIGSGDANRRYLIVA